MLLPEQLLLAVFNNMYDVIKKAGLLPLENNSFVLFVLLLLIANVMEPVLEAWGKKN